MYTALVLAGGAGRRLGGPGKPVLPVGGAPMLARVLAAVADATARVVVGPDALALPSGVLRTIERPAGGGPVAAVEAGLPLVRTEVVVLLAADLPFLTPEAVAHLRAALDRARPDGHVAAADGVVFVDETGRRQTLCGAWRAAALRRRIELLRQASGERDLAGTSLRVLLSGLRVAEVSHRGDGPPPWYDCDTQTEWELAERWAHDATG